MKSIAWDGKDYTYTPLDTSEGRDITGVVITLTTRTTTLSGAVPGTESRPDGAAVIAFPVEREQWVDFGLQPTRVVSVGVSNNGTYRMTLPAGDYNVIAVDGRRAEGWQQPAFFESASRVAARVTLEHGDTKVQDLVVREVR